LTHPSRGQARQTTNQKRKEAQEEEERILAMKVKKRGERRKRLIGYVRRRLSRKVRMGFSERDLWLTVMYTDANPRNVPTINSP
jgi:hypothetical protein